MSVSRPLPTLARATRLLVLGLVLGVCAVVVPDSSPASTQVVLVRVDRASGVDLSPHVIWILAVGSDARPGEDMTRTRGDALQMIGINPGTGAAAAIGVPRDSYVDIPGIGHDKINAALSYGGPQLLGRVVGDLVGVQPDYVFVTRFTFFQDMMRYVGHIHVDNPVAFDDEYLKPSGFPAGRIKLGPYTAFAFARIRHNLLRGDFDRSANQQRVIGGIQRVIRARADRPGFLEGGVMTVLKHMYTNLSPSELFRIAAAIAEVRPSKVTTCVVQGGIGDINGASVVLPYVDQAHALGREAGDDATLEHC